MVSMSNGSRVFPMSSVSLLNLSKISSAWNPTAPGAHHPAPAATPAGSAVTPVLAHSASAVVVNLAESAVGHVPSPVSVQTAATLNGAAALCALKEDRIKLEMCDTASITSEDDFDEKNSDPNDAEGVWSPDIEQSFHEALAIYPPCGRRKIILSDEGKMYGRNELIARYIKLRTGKCRTRKQVSSHIQVLARRKLRELQAKMKNTSPLATLHEQAAKEKALHTVANMSSAQIISASGGVPHPKSLSGFGLPVHNGYSPSSHHAASLGANAAAVGAMAPGFWPTSIHGVTQDMKAFPHHPYAMTSKVMTPSVPSVTSSIPASVIGADMSHLLTGHAHPPPPAWEGRSIATPKLRLVEYSAFMEVQNSPNSEHEGVTDMYNRHLFVHIGGSNWYEQLETIAITQIYDKFPDKKGGLRELYDKGPSNSFFLVKFWADLNTNIQESVGAFYGVTSQYESPDSMTITCSTKVCSFGKQVVEKVETEYSRFENGRFVYRISRSQMCEYMVNFIHKLKHLPEKYMMNSVLENFTILQVVTNKDTLETLLCIAFVFEVSTSEHGAQHHIYRLVKD